MPKTNIIPEKPNSECVLVKFHKKLLGKGNVCQSCTNNVERKRYGCPIIAGATLAEIYRPTLEKAIQKGLEKAFTDSAEDYLVNKERKHHEM